MNNYYQQLYKKIKNKEFRILEINSLPKDFINVHVETLNYILWEWNQDHKDDRNDIFEFVVIPYDSDFDFTTLSIDDFLTQFMKLKDTKNEQIDIENIDILTEIPIEYIVIDNKKDLDDFWN